MDVAFTLLIRAVGVILAFGGFAPAAWPFGKAAGRLRDSGFLLWQMARVHGLVAALDAMTTQEVRVLLLAVIMTVPGLVLLFG